MRYKIGRCKDKNCNKDFKCERQVKILLCQQTEHVAFYTKDTHNAEFVDRNPNHHGITPSVKDKLEDLIFNYDSRPKRLNLKLEKLRRSKKFKIGKLMLILSSLIGSNKIDNLFFPFD